MALQFSPPQIPHTFNPRPVHVGLVAAKVAFGQIFPLPMKSKILSSVPRFRKLLAHVLPLSERDQVSYPCKTKGKITVKMHRKLGRRCVQHRQCRRTNIPGKINK